MFEVEDKPDDTMAGAGGGFTGQNAIDMGVNRSRTADLGSLTAQRSASELSNYNPTSPRKSKGAKDLPATPGGTASKSGAGSEESPLEEKMDEEDDTYVQQGRGGLGGRKRGTTTKV